MDHCVPKPLRRWLPGEEVRTCHEQGWDALTNGKLLAEAESAGFEIFITADQNLRYQQNLSGRRLAIIELPTNRLSVLPFLTPALLIAIQAATPGATSRFPFRDNNAASQILRMSDQRPVVPQDFRDRHEDSVGLLVAGPRAWDEELHFKRMGTHIGRRYQPPMGMVRGPRVAIVRADPDGLRGERE